MTEPIPTHIEDGTNRCRGRWVDLDGEPHFVCDLCREWCDGQPCDGLTDDDVRALAQDAQDQLRNYHR